MFSILFLFAEMIPARFLGPALREWILNVGGWMLGSLGGPILVASTMTRVMAAWWPETKASWSLPPVVAFALSFVALDYASYWVHRINHQMPLWRFHFVHHTVVRLNGIAAGRHSLAEGLLNPLVPVHGVLLFLLADPFAYAVGLTTTLVLDVWRHAPVTTHRSNLVARALHGLLITPEDHGVHHRASAQANFGANLKVWDRLHGTYQSPSSEPFVMGEPTAEGVLQLLVWGARDRHSLTRTDAE